MLHLIPDTRRKAAKVFFIQAVSVVLSFWVSVLLARHLGVGDFGIYSLTLSLVFILAVPCSMGLPIFVARETAKFRTNEQFNEIQFLLSWAKESLYTITIFVICIFLFADIVFSIVELPIQMLITGAVILFLVGGNSVQSASIRGLGYVVQGQVPQTIVQPIAIILLTLLVVNTNTIQINASYSLIIYAVGSLFAYSAGLIYLKVLSPKRNFYNVDKPNTKGWIKTSFVISVTSSAMILNSNLDILMLGKLTSSMEVGFYKVGVTLAMLLSTGLNVLVIVIQPRIVELYTKDNLIALRSLITSTSRLGFILSFLGALIYFVGGEYFIRTVYGNDYEPSVQILYVLVFGQLINTFFGPVVLLLNMTGHQRVVMLSAVSLTVGNIVLNALLIPIYGMIGAAVATVTTLLFWNLLLWFMSMKIISIDCSFFGKHNKGCLQ